MKLQISQTANQVNICLYEKSFVIFFFTTICEGFSLYSHFWCPMMIWIMGTNKPCMACSTQKMRQKRTFIGVCTAYIFASLGLKKTIVLRLEIIFFNNHYFIVCIFQYQKSLRMSSGLNNQRRYFIQKYLQQQHNKENRSNTKAEGKCVLVRAFNGNWMIAFVRHSNSFLCNPLRCCAFPGVPVCSHSGS